MSLAVLKREDFLYQPCYCEENIWHLCQHKQFKNSCIIFIASKGGSFPMLNQRAMDNPSMPVYWDYHVILLVLSEKNTVLDFDTSLPFSIDVDTYFSRSFLDNKLLSIKEMPLFRVVPASEFITVFSSDRSHMKTDSGWYAPPPDWPLIRENETNLSDFIDMTNNEIGEVLTYDDVLERFS
ncbi:hypothetical protein [Psychromonas ossibalaenae]|uniref:hypothetical protein n=1 Tax=Psychromonas ossibalaenae TaxID=444922 RepID=UPI00037AE58C|nr:hypothetical protein [Psychromonas ossibalaenae]